MDTNELIKTLAADARRPGPSLDSVWWGAAGLAVLCAAALFFATLGPRPDFAAAAETPRFLFKFVVMIALAVSAFTLTRELSRPGETWRKLLPWLAAAPALMVVAVAFELLVVPLDQWAAKIIGRNALVCLTSIPLIGLGPLAIFVLALRHGAPASPAVAGAVAGIFAGGIAASLYAAQCADDSPLFVAVWYTLAIAGLGLLGAAAGHRFARW